MAVTSLVKKLLIYLYILLRSPFMLANFGADVVSYLVPWFRPDRRWSLEQAVRNRLVRLVLTYWSLARAGDRLSLKEGKERNRFEIFRPRSEKIYKGVLADATIKPDTIGATWTPARPPTPALVKPDLTVILHFHGGAFVIGNGRDEDMGFFARTMIKQMGCSHVCTPQYRLANSRDGRFPAAFQDALTVYMTLIHDKGIPASQIILSGDSAGATIALGLLRYIHEHGEEVQIPAPAAVTMWSPWVDVNVALGASASSSPRWKLDYVTPGFGRWGARAITGDGIIDAANPYISPLRHPFKLKEDIPMYVNVGEHEVQVDDVRDFSRRNERVGWNVHTFVSPGCPHDILLLGPKLGFVKECEEAAAVGGRFLVEATDLPLRAGVSPL